MNFSEITKVIDRLGKDRGVDKKVIIEVLEQAMLMAAKKKFGPTAELEAHWNEESGEVEVYQFKTVKPKEGEVEDKIREITFEEALQLDEEVSPGDELGIKLDSVDFGRIDAQTAKQIIFQKFRDMDREIVYKEYIGHKGQIVTGTARRIERGSLVMDLGRTEAYLPRNAIIPGEVFHHGDRVQSLLQDVNETTRGPQLMLSRTSPEFLMKLFEIEVPEIAEKIVEITRCVREPGERAKISVISHDRDVDPVGASVGMKGIRVQSVVQELRGEKIDIIPWNEDITVFIRSAMVPAEISMVRVMPATNSLELVVEDDNLSLAIGRKGQNVRLASQLTGWTVDILSKTKLNQRTRQVLQEFKLIEALNDTLSQSIYGCGFLSVKEVADCDEETLARIPGFEAEGAALSLKERAAATVQKIKENPDLIPKIETPAEGAGTPMREKKEAKTKEDVEIRLKEELAQMNKRKNEKDNKDNGNSAPNSDTV